MLVARAAALIAGAAMVIGMPLSSADAQSKDAVVLAPLQSVGGESAGGELGKQIEQQLRTDKGFKVIASKRLARAIKRSRDAEVTTCDGAPACLTKTAKLVGARFIIYGEVGGIGDARVIYLKVVDAGNGAQLRSTTLEVSDKPQPATRAALARLLRPGRYKGTLAIELSVQGASVFVDGRRVGKSPLRPQKLSVGTHALRVTHPEYRDFVRFVDVSYGHTETLKVDLAQYGVVSSEISREGGNGTVIRRDEGPPQEPAWYARWYVITGAIVIVGVIASAVVVGALTAEDIDFDAKRLGAAAPVLRF